MARAFRTSTRWYAYDLTHARNSMDILFEPGIAVCGDDELRGIQLIVQHVPTNGSDGILAEVIRDHLLDA